jgi:protein SPT2
MNMVQVQEDKKKKMLDEENKKKIEEAAFKEDLVRRKATETLLKSTQKGPSASPMRPVEETSPNKRPTLTYDQLMAQAERNAQTGAFSTLKNSPTDEKIPGSSNSGKLSNIKSSSKAGTIQKSSSFPQNPILKRQLSRDISNSNISGSVSTISSSSRRLDQPRANSALPTLSSGISSSSRLPDRNSTSSHAPNISRSFSTLASSSSVSKPSSQFLSANVKRIPANSMMKGKRKIKGVIPAPSDLKRLNQKKRDIRTIEEIQADLRQKKTTSEVNSNNSEVNSRRSDSESSSRNDKRPKKTIKSSANKESISDMIQSMFRKPNSVVRNYEDYDDDDLSDMEAGVKEMEYEELRSRYHGKREDLEEEERQKRREKKRLKRA